MGVETLHPDPVEPGQVIREIIPGGHEDRTYLLYEDRRAALLAQKLHRSRFVPRIIGQLLDEGMNVDRSRLDESPTDESETLLQDTLGSWRENEEEFRHAS